MKRLALLLLLIFCAPAFAHRVHGGTIATPPTGGCLPTASSTGYDGCISRNSAGLLVNGHGTNIQLRGANTGMTGTYNGNSGPYQCLNGMANVPWGTLATVWRVNAVRAPLDLSAFLNVTIGLVGGSATSPNWSGTTAGDPSGVYKNCVISFINQSRLYGFYPLLEDHFSAPKYTFGGVTAYLPSWGQPLGPEADMAVPFWSATWAAGPGSTDSSGYPSSGIVGFLAHFWGSASFNTSHSIPGAGNVVGAAGQFNNSNYGGATGFGDVMFELFNEPQLNGQTVNLNTQNLGAGSTVSMTSCMLNGCWVSGYCNQNIGTGYLSGFGNVGAPTSIYGASGQPNTTTDAYCFNYWNQIAGYQTLLNGIRSQGATNLVDIAGENYDQAFTQLYQYLPTDTLSPVQLLAQWHPYGNGTFPASADPNMGFAWNGTAYAVQAAAPVISGASSATIDGNTYTYPGIALPIIADETGTNCTNNPTDPYLTSIEQWADGLTDTHSGTVSPGKFNPFIWSFPDPGGPAPYGTGNVGCYQSGWETVVLGPTQTISASLSTTVQSGYDFTTGTMTVTNANGNNLALSSTNGQWYVTGGAGVNNFTIGPQISGTPGGAGVYVVFYPQNQSITTLTIQQWLPGGEGTVWYNWTQPHSELMPVTFGLEEFQKAANDAQYRIKRAA